ncbi:hypothetical protein Xcel_1747 [Xylanimonas cellulosilytica DSM 15894]|uniref:Lipoprotein n=1 Tax=Xylanimonas cellulosilytica (strain DSM 15894 / JCM 12276 / CECT 5975 / KCTC 9989 / LMG 20990 / NBRC 107835 / XIL07) TaxID=446471 RepID=D1BSS8_XYLCX|nr:hypothetical protein [Xylanimonas cellulosilytica]ACZ30770.1 hypothetical protein Xcel_1747 [Xylanimonas cellulosilytica DSM 15894]
MRVGHIAVLAIVTLSLSGLTVGCMAADRPSSDSLPGTAGVPSATGVPIRVEINGVLVDETDLEATQAWNIGGKLVVTTYGSGSCPFVPEVTSVDEESRVISVKMTMAGGDTCTADSRPRTFELDVDTDGDLDEFSVQMTWP